MPTQTEANAGGLLKSIKDAFNWAPKKAETATPAAAEMPGVSPVTPTPEASQAMVSVPTVTEAPPAQELASASGLPDWLSAPSAVEPTPTPTPESAVAPAATPDWLQGGQMAVEEMAPAAEEPVGGKGDDFGGYRLAPEAKGGIVKKDKLIGEIIGPDGQRFVGKVERTLEGLKIVGATDTEGFIRTQDREIVDRIETPVAPAALSAVEAPVVEAPVPAAAVEAKTEADPFSVNREFNGYMETIRQAQAVLASGVALTPEEQKKALIAVARSNSLLPKLPPEVLESVLLMRVVASGNPKFGREDFQMEMLAAMEVIKTGTAVKG